jgi:hypothetical protein
MNHLTLPNPKVRISRIGLQITGDLSVAEWQELASSIGEVASSIAFIVGDWLVYGQQNLFAFYGKDDGDRFPDKRVKHPDYELAIKATGLDLSTLQNYAYVSRSIPYSRRTERLSWEHHRLMAKLPEADQQDWIEACVAEEDAGRRMSTRRLRKSLNLGRIATDQDMEPDESDKGIDNHIPFVNRLSVWWKRMNANRFLDTASHEQRQALKRDLEPVVSIYNQL